MARKTVMVCDSCGTAIDDGTGANVRVNPVDRRKSAKSGDYCDTCAENVAGVPTARRGRKPKV